MGITNRSWDSAFVATPNNTANSVDPHGPFAALLVWVAGTVEFIDEAGNDSGVSGSLPAGTMIFCKATRLVLAGTSATVLGLKAPA